MAVMEKKPKTVWAGKFRKARKLAKLSQPEAADRLEVPVTTIRGWEQGRHTPPLYVQRFILRLLSQHGD